MNIEEEKSLKKLREIFFAERDDRQEEFEKEIESIKYRLNNKDAKIEAYYPIVTDLLERKIRNSEDEVAQVLSPILGKALKKQIEESKDDIIDALYPIMGETIKKTVAESIKEIYNSLNQKIDNALRRGIFSKQVKSKITGISANDLILQGAFPFSVNEIFLIHEESGILISHVSADNVKTSDADLVSGMLTAIKDFVKESFRSDSGTQNLYEIQYGDSKIILERGRYSYLAIVVSGQEPPEFDNDLTDFNLEIHKKFANKLNEFDGHVSKLKGIEKYLKSFISQFSTSEEDSENEPKPILIYLLLGLLIIALIIWGIFTIPPYLKDKTIVEQASEKLKEVENLELGSIELSSEKSTLTIDGFVQNYNQKYLVDSIISSIPEVEQIEDRLGVMFIPQNSKKISDAIDKILIKNNYIEVDYIIKKDIVTINGLIKSEEDKILFANKIAKVSGVRVVINNLQVETVAEILTKLILEFEHKKVELTDQHFSTLNYLFHLLKDDEYMLRITGRADGRYSESNLNIATERAENVKKYLVNRGLDENKIETYSEIKSERAVKFELISPE